MKQPLKIYPSRLRPIVAVLVGLVLLTVVISKMGFNPMQPTHPWYMNVVFYGLPVLCVILGLKAALFPKPQVILFEDGFAYPKLGLKHLPWSDVKGTFQHGSVQQIGRRQKIAPTPSDRRLDLFVEPDSPALEQIRPVFRRMLEKREGCVVIPISLMGSKTSTPDLQKIIEALIS